ncbi:hypothetical protein SSX86_008150 [Deinandra increscens subsp. villosa]|uniref:Peptidase C14 caspase domain-containing protein n=1 Tax=Deinandra increscens subsp. villosa TaxID=3103831 RepID=A0AAP0DC17_9ASTR
MQLAVSAIKPLVHRGQPCYLEGRIEESKESCEKFTKEVTLVQDFTIEMDSHPHPTKRNIQEALRWLVRDNQPGDTVVFYFSGHGVWKPDFFDDEVDGFNESICTVDFRTADNRSPSGVYKGTSGKYVISISGCEDNQLAADTSASRSSSCIFARLVSRALILGAGANGDNGACLDRIMYGLILLMHITWFTSMQKVAIQEQITRVLSRLMLLVHQRMEACS